MAVDTSSGAPDIFFADSLTHAIFRLAPSTTVPALWAGKRDVRGFVNAPAGADARFDTPLGLLLLPDLDIIVADAGNQAVRRVHRATGETTTICGGNGIGTLDGECASAQFSDRIWGMAYDAARDILYVADAIAVRAIENGVTNTRHLTNIYTGFPLNQPLSLFSSFITSLALSPDGNTLFAADFDFSRVAALNSAPGNSNWRTIVGGTFDTNNYIQSYPVGYVDGVGGGTRLNHPSQMVISPDGLVLYIVDTGNVRVRAIEISSGTISTVVGNGQASYFIPGRDTSSSIGGCFALTVDANGVLYSYDWYHHVVYSVSGLPDSPLVNQFTQEDTVFADGIGADARFLEPSGIAFDALGDIIVADSGNHRIRKVRMNGAVTTIAGSDASGGTNGPASSATFTAPTDVAFHQASGDIYIVDFGANNLRVLRAATNTVELFAGSISGAGGTTDGALTSARFSQPKSIASSKDAIFVLDGVGEFLDELACRGRMIRSGQVTTVIANTCIGTILQLKFVYYSSIAASPDGRFVYWTDGCAFGTLDLNTMDISYSGGKDPKDRCSLPLQNTFPRDVDGNADTTPKAFGSYLSSIAVDPRDPSRLLLGEYYPGSIRQAQANNASGWISTIFSSVVRSPRMTYSVYGVRDGPTNAADGGMVTATKLAISPVSGDAYFLDMQQRRIGRIGTLAGDACLASSPTCGPGTVIVWENRTCVPCPPDGAFGAAYSSYCIAANGRVYVPPPSPSPTPTPSITATPSPIQPKAIASGSDGPGPSAGAGIGVGVFVAAAAIVSGVLWQRRSAAARAKVLRGDSVEGDAVDALVSAINKSQSRRTLVTELRVGDTAAGERPADVETLRFSDLSPDASIAPVFGGFGVIFCATWVSRGIRVAIKIPKDLIVSSYLPPAAAGELVKEAQGLVRASDGNVNEYVVRLYGVAQGSAGAQWTSICDRAREIHFAKKSGAALAVPVSAATKGQLSTTSSLTGARPESSFSFSSSRQTAVSAAGGKSGIELQVPTPCPTRRSVAPRLVCPTYLKPLLSAQARPRYGLGGRRHTGRHNEARRGLSSRGLALGSWRQATSGARALRRPLPPAPRRNHPRRPQARECASVRRRQEGSAR